LPPVLSLHGNVSESFRVSFEGEGGERESEEKWWL